MNIDDFLESISESEYVFFHRPTGLFFSWNGLSVIQVWSTDEDNYEDIDMFTVESGKDSDHIQGEIDSYIEKLESEE